MEMNRYRGDMDQRRADMNQCQANMDQPQVDMNQFQVNMEQPRGDVNQLRANTSQSGGDMDQLQMNIGQFQAPKARPHVDKIQPRVKKNLRRADGDRLPRIALKPGSGSVGFGLGGLHLEQCHREVISSEAISPEAIGLETISLEAELPEVLFDGMRAFIAANPSWDQYSLITSALACFLFQNGCSDKCVTQHYLDSLFSRN